MHFLEQLARARAQNRSLLCVGLDPEPQRFPAALQGNSGAIYDFCAAVVDATADLVCAFKPQVAYFAAHRAEDQLERLMAHMRRVAPSVPVILDAKRGDIGQTSRQYAREAFERYAADAVTVSPWMGLDSIAPYLDWPGKGVFVLCRTSNPGSDDLQALPLAQGGLLYEHLARLAQGSWNLNGQMGLVVGATRPQDIARVRACAPTLPLLIPGVGAQGGDARAAVRAALGERAEGERAEGEGQGLAPVLINASRAVLYASSGADFARAARARAEAMRAELEAACGPENTDGYAWHPDGTLAGSDQIFVFGSNLAGLHGGGAAQVAAKHYGAVWGQGTGLAGRSWAIATIGNGGRPLPLEQVAEQVARFRAFAMAHPDRKFFITRVGCGIAGFRDADIAPMFRGCPANCDFPQPWKQWIAPLGA